MAKLFVKKHKSVCHSLKSSEAGIRTLINQRARPIRIYYYSVPLLKN